MEERALEAEAELSAERQRLAVEAAQARRKAAEDFKELKQTSDAKLEDVSNNLRKQVRGWDNTVHLKGAGEGQRSLVRCGMG